MKSILIVNEFFYYGLVYIFTYIFITSKTRFSIPKIKRIRIYILWNNSHYHESLLKQFLKYDETTFNPEPITKLHFCGLKDSSISKKISLHIFLVPLSFYSVFMIRTTGLINRCATIYPIAAIMCLPRTDFHLS